MTIYDFLEMLNESHEMVFTLFNYSSENLVFMSTDEAENTCQFSREDLLYSEYADCEIGSMDVWVENNGVIHFELNIEVEEEEE